MAASVLTLFLNNPLQSGSSAGLLGTAQPTASTSTTKWTVGTVSASFPFSLMSYELTTTQFNSGTQPASGPAVAAAHFAQDCWRLSAVTSGTFSAGTWSSAGSMISVSAGLSGAGRLRWRLYRASSVSGANATQLTAGTMVGTTITNLSTTVAKSSSASTQIGAVTLTNEFLFLQCAWEITTASASASADAAWRMGPITNITNGSLLVTPTFTPTGGGGATVATGFYTHRKHYDLVN